MKAYKFTNTNYPIPDVTIEYLKEKYTKGCIFGRENLLHSGCYKIMGWIFDVRDDFPLFLYKQYGVWREAHAPNRTALRKATYGKIDKIVNL